MFQCPDSSSKKDLLAYLQRIALYCHQLNITSKVKADVQSVSGELIVSGVSKTRPKWVFENYFFLSLNQNNMLWILKRTVSMRRFF